MGLFSAHANRVIWRVLEMLVAALFIYAGALKVLEPVAFARDIDNYQILPWSIGVGLAFYLPWLEIFCGLALLFRRFHVGSLAIFAVLTGTFILASIVARSRGLDVSCGCFGHVAKDMSFAN